MQLTQLYSLTKTVKNQIEAMVYNDYVFFQKQSFFEDKKRRQKHYVSSQSSSYPQLVSGRWLLDMGINAELSEIP